MITAVRGRDSRTYHRKYFRIEVFYSVEPYGREVWLVQVGEKGYDMAFAESKTLRSSQLIKYLRLGMIKYFATGVVEGPSYSDLDDQ